MAQHAKSSRRGSRLGLTSLERACGYVWQVFSNKTVILESIMARNGPSWQVRRFPRASRRRRRHRRCTLLP